MLTPETAGQSAPDPDPTPSFQLELEWRVMFCNEHLLPMKATWPAGATQAMLGLFTAAVRSEKIVELTGGDPEKLNEVFHRVGPVCCFLDPGIAEQVVQMALDGKIWGKDKPTSP